MICNRTFSRESIKSKRTLLVVSSPHLRRVGTWLVEGIGPLSRLVSCFGEAAVDIPENERSGILLIYSQYVNTTMVVVYTYILRLAWNRVPPTSDYDHTTRQDNAFVSPQTRHIHCAVAIHVILHHGHTHPPGNALLRRKRVKPTA